MLLRSSILCLSCVLIFAATEFGESAGIVLKEHPVRSSCGFFAPVIENATIDDKVIVTGREGEWLQVRFGEKKGCIHRCAIDTGKKIPPIFSALTEMLLWKEKPDLDFSAIDRVEEYHLPDYIIRDFIKSGGLDLLQ